METLVQGAEEDGLKHDGEVLSVTHHKEQLGMREARESPELPGQHRAAGAGLSESHPHPVPLVTGHSGVGAGLEAWQVPFILQLFSGDYQHVTGHFNYFSTFGNT